MISSCKMDGTKVVQVRNLIEIVSKRKNYLLFSIGYYKSRKSHCCWPCGIQIAKVSKLQSISNTVKYLEKSTTYVDATSIVWKNGVNLNEKLEWRKDINLRNKEDELQNYLVDCFESSCREYLTLFHQQLRIVKILQLA